MSIDINKAEHCGAGCRDLYSEALKSGLLQSLALL